MNRRQLLFIVLVNGLVSLVIAVAVLWVAERRRPDLEELAARYTPPPPVVLMVTPTVPDQTEQAVPATPTTTQPLATPTATEPGEPEVYVVQAGDTMLQIAVRYGLTTAELMEANNLTDPDFVFVGQRLVIPLPDATGNGGDPAPPTRIPQGLQLRIENPGNLDGERVQVINESNAAVNLQGWTLSRGGGPIYTFGDLPVFPGGSIRLNSAGGVDNSLDRFWGQPQAVWTAGAVATLRSPEGDLVASETAP